MIKGPKNAQPTLRGWVNAKGELLKAQKFSQEQLDEYNGVGKEVVKAAAPVQTKKAKKVEEQVKTVPTMLNEAPPNNKSLEEMTDNELEALSEQMGTDDQEQITE